MSIFDIFQKPEDLGNLPKDPVGFVNALLKRKHWRKIQPTILFEIAQDTGGKHEALIMFAYISEIGGLVEKNYVRASEHSEDLPPRVAFGCSLYLLGVRELRAYYQAAGREASGRSHMLADLAFSASLLCDPLQIGSYAYMANLFASAESNRELALESCENFRNALDKVMSAPVESLSSFHQSMRMELESPEIFNQFFDHISSLGGPSFDGGGFADIKRYVEELDKSLREFDPQNPRDDALNALRKAIKQML